MRSKARVASTDQFGGKNQRSSLSPKREMISSERERSQVCRFV